MNDHRPFGSQFLRIVQDPLADRAPGTKPPVRWISGGSAPPDNVVRTVSNWEHFDGALVAIGVTDDKTITIGGSGVMVAPGLVLTAKHVVDDYADAVGNRELDYCCIGPRSSGNADFWRGVSLRYAENESDTAFLGVKLNSSIEPNWAVSCFPISVIPPRPAEMLTLVGFRFQQPDSIKSERVGDITVVAKGDLHASAGRVAAFHPYARGSVMPFPTIEISSGSVGGMSGGAVLDRNGAIVGLVSRGFTAVDGLGPTYAAWILQALMFEVVLPWPKGVYVPDTPLLNLPRDCIRIEGRQRVRLSALRREITYRRWPWLPTPLERLAMRILAQQPPRRRSPRTGLSQLICLPCRKAVADWKRTNEGRRSSRLDTMPAMTDEVETTWIGDNPSPEVAASHLRDVVVETARFETGRLVTPEDTAFFGAVRAVMSDMEYVASLYCGWDGENRRRIQTAGKTISFMDEVMAAATGNDGYSTYGRHLYELYRCGLVHQRSPKVLRSETASTQLLGWALMYSRVDRLGPHRGNVEVEHLRIQVVDNDLALLPVSVLAIYEDFLVACEHFASLLETEAAAEESELLTRWWQTWNALGTPENTRLTW